MGTKDKHKSCEIRMMIHLSLEQGSTQRKACAKFGRIAPAVAFQLTASHGAKEAGASSSVARLPTAA